MIAPTKGWNTVRDESLAALKKQHEIVTASPEAARVFLVSLGILHEDGSIDCENYPEMKRQMKEDKKNKEK